MIDQVINYIDANQPDFVQRLLDFLRIKSISTEAACNGDTRLAANWVKAHFDGCGIAAEIVETPRHPCVIADTGPVNGDHTPTVLVYGHYDVQPTIDLELWKSPPFEPQVRDGRIYARGAADDKGQVFTHLLAAEAWMKTAGKLPTRVKFMIEGEEEIGSPNLTELVKREKERLACDYIAISDTGKFSDTTPAITYGTKGLIYKEVNLSGAFNNLHSGSYGGTIPNPANVLAHIIASLKDRKQRVTVPGFYDDVRPISKAEKSHLAALKFNESAYARKIGVKRLVGEQGYTTLERRWARPTVDVCGLYGGFQGEGSSTIIPAKVGAKVSMRLVPDQDPKKISAAFDAYVKELADGTVKVEIKDFGHYAAYVTPTESPGVLAAINAVRKGFKKKPVMIREGGSLPILPMFKKVLHADSIMMGFSNPNSNVHGPNEFFDVADFHAGTRSAAHFLNELATAP